LSRESKTQHELFVYLPDLWGWNDCGGEDRHIFNDLVMATDKSSKFALAEKNRQDELSMKWKNANLDELPAHEQNVLIAVDGIYYLTIFDANSKVFRLAGDLKSTFEILETQPIYWLPIDVPPQERNAY
jgi:hypothetical protein